MSKRFLPLAGLALTAALFSPAAENSTPRSASQANLSIGINLETENAKASRPTHFCDVASARKIWKKEPLLRVWQRGPLGVTNGPHVPYNPPTE